jgi:L-threonylcarbamoyladenylate synthase
MFSVRTRRDGQLRPRYRRRFVEALRADRVVAVPAEGGYSLALSGLATTTAERLAPLESLAAVSLILGDPSQAADWCTGLPASVRRMLRRAWPGSLVVEVPWREPSLAGQLPASTRQWLGRHGAVRLSIPKQSPAQQLSQSLGEPLVLAQPKPPILSTQMLAEGWAEWLAVVADAGTLTPGASETVIRIAPDAPQGWQLIQAGAITVDQLQQWSACVVVFVCTGNTCRSPLAEGICKQLLAERLGCTPADLPQRGFIIHSAGLAAYEGEPASELTVEVAQEMGIDLSQHHSQPLTAELAHAADVLVAMTRSHAQTILARYSPGVPLRLLCGYNKDLVDPIGGDLTVYQQCAATIREHVTTLVAELHQA